MALPTFTLGGKALMGIKPDLHTAEVMAALPTKVKLGCRGVGGFPGRAMLNLAKYANVAAVDFPAYLDWSNSDAGRQSVARWFKNDTLGTCVLAEFWHGVGIQAGMDTGRLVAPTDQQIEQQYIDVCRPGVLGCYVSAMYTQAQFFGLPDSNGQIHTTSNFVGVPPGDNRFVQYPIMLMGGVGIAMNFPEAWFYSDVWGPTDSKIVGGHMVRGFGWTPEGVLVASWGRVYLMTWQVMATLGRWVFALVAAVGPDWWNSDQLAPNHFDAATLKKDIDALGRGEFPPIVPGPGTSDTLLPGGILRPGDQLVSQNQRFILSMQREDGNLVLRDSSGGVLWHAWTFGHPGAFAKEQAEDGNFVCYAPDGVTPLWHAWTFGHPGARVNLQNDGNLVVKVGNNPPIWNSQTGGH